MQAHLSGPEELYSWFVILKEIELPDISFCVAGSPPWCLSLYRGICLRALWGTRTCVRMSDQTGITITEQTAEQSEEIHFIGDVDIPPSQRLIVKFHNENGVPFLCNIPVSMLSRPFVFAVCSPLEDSIT